MNTFKIIAKEVGIVLAVYIAIVAYLVAWVWVSTTPAYPYVIVAAWVWIIYSVVVYIRRRVRENREHQATMARWDEEAKVLTELLALDTKHHGTFMANINQAPYEWKGVTYQPGESLTLDEEARREVLSAQFKAQIAARVSA